MINQKNSVVRFLYPLLIASIYLFLYLPILVLVLFSFNDSPVSASWVGFTMKWYKEIAKNAELIEAFQASMIIAISSTLLSVLLGTSFVLGSKYWKPSWYYLFQVNVLFPEVIMAIGVLLFFSFFNISTGYVSLITGHTLLGLGFVVPIIRSRFDELDPALTEASLDLGASYFQTLYKIYIPLLFPAIFAASLLVFTLSLDDFLIAFFCSSPTVQTLSVYIYALARTGVDPTINAISTFFLLVSSLIVLILCATGVAERVLSHD